MGKHLKFKRKDDTDSYYKDMIHVFRECRDCEMLKEHSDVTVRYLWICEGYNITPGVQ